MVLPLFALPVLQAPAAAPSPAVALELKAPDEVSKDLEAEIRARLEKAGVQVLPEGPGTQVLRLSAKLEIRKDGAYSACVTTLRGTSQELEPQKDAEGRPAGPWPKLAYLALVNDRQVAQQRLKEGAVQAALRATKDLIPSTEPARTETTALRVASGSAVGGVPGGVVGGVVGGTGKVVDFKFQELKVRFQPPVPPYPIVAKIARIQGTVRAELVLDAEGVPQEARLLSGPAALADTVLAYGLKWRFEPPVFDGKRMPGRFILEMPFHLQ